MDRDITIGYVGQTGVATGPHLHYEVLVNGKKVDPSKGKFPIDPTSIAKSTEAAGKIQSGYASPWAAEAYGFESTVAQRRSARCIICGDAVRFRPLADTRLADTVKPMTDYDPEDRW